MDRRAVYQYKRPGADGFSGLAMDVHLHGGRLRFFDTLRGHELEGSLGQEQDDAFTYESESAVPGVWQFQVLTLAEFKARAYKNVVDGDVLAATIKSTEDLHEWYRKEYGMP